MSISLSLVLNGDEYIDTAKYNVTKWFLDRVLSISQLPSVSKIRLVNRTFPVTSITLDGYFTDFAEFKAMLDAMEDTDVRKATNNTFTMIRDGTTYAPKMLQASLKAQSDVQQGEDKIGVVISLLVESV